MSDSASDPRLRDLKDQVRHLEVSVKELTILNDIATAISSASSLEEIIELIIRKCIKHLRVEQGAVTLLDPKDEENPFRTMVRGADTSRKVTPYRLDMVLKGWMLKYQKPLVIDDLRTDERFKHFRKEETPIRSVLSVPMMLKGRMIGLLNAFNKKGSGGFTDGDRRLLSIIASQSAQVVENARLHEEEQALIAVRKEMELAYSIQTDLLPTNAPDLPDYDIAGTSLPAKTVGGDYFDFIDGGKGRLILCVGDVSGKGMPAALLMANLQATLRCLVLQDTDPSNCLERANKLMFESTGAERFVTLFLGLLDATNHILTYASAGHNPPLLFREGEEPAVLSARGIILGCFENATYSPESVPLKPGDILLAYSDGVTEAINSFEEEFGVENLKEMVLANRDDDVGTLIQKVTEAVRRHQSGSAQLDDMTLIALKCTR